MRTFRKYYIKELPHALFGLNPKNFSLKKFLYLFLKKAALKKFLIFYQKKAFLTFREMELFNQSSGK